MQEEMEKILKEAALAAERAYRRGFQHGVLHASEMGINGDDAHNYRFSVGYARAWGAPERDQSGVVRNPWKGTVHSLIERHFGIEGSDVHLPILTKAARIAKRPRVVTSSKGRIMISDGESRL